LIETGTLEDIFVSEKHHPYTVGLFGAIPDLTTDSKRLSPIGGLMPDPSKLSKGCNFQERCPHCMEICKNKKPEVYVKGTHKIACNLFSIKPSQRGDHHE
jgi:peptide/nickel transport system ATP-binding protein